MLTSHELFGFMSPSLALEILTYVYESDKPLYRATLSAVAEARKVRPVFLERRPRAQHAADMSIDRRKKYKKGRRAGHTLGGEGAEKE